MVVFILQSLFLIAAAFIAGAISGNVFKRFSGQKESVSEHSTRAADARLASQPALGVAANDDVARSARAAAAMVPPAEPVPAISPVSAKRKTARKNAAKPAVKAQNPRQDDRKSPTGPEGRTPGQAGPADRDRWHWQRYPVQALRARHLPSRPDRRLDCRAGLMGQ